MEPQMKAMKYLLTTGLAIGLWGGAQAATIVDLTTPGASGHANGAFFQQISSQSTGTGVIDPFLRIQANGTEQGFNNSVDQFTLDDVAKGGQNYNHDLRLSNVPVVGINGVNYYQFLLDINQNGQSESLLSLFDMQIWLRGSPITDLSHPRGTYGDLTGSGAALAWDLVGNIVELKADLNPGSGAGDMFAYIPQSVLGTGNEYVYLYSAFGDPNRSNDGFEEWSILKGGSSVPDGGLTVALLGSALMGLGMLRKRFSTK
jgi:VPDSG-CTERM motif